MKNVNSLDLDNVINAGGMVLVDFTATWCGPCKRQTPILEQFESQNPQVNVATVDIDEAKDLVDRYSIKSVPTLILFKDGTKVDVKSGLTSLAVLNTLVKNNF